MSQAFTTKWNSTSAAQRLLILLTSIAKQRHQQNEPPLTFDLDALEAVTATDGLVQTIEGDKVIMRYVSDDAKLFFIGTAQATEREARRQPQWPASETEVPSRLSEVLTPVPQRQPIVTTTDDGEMAAREQASVRTATQREAARKRNQPLPLTNVPPMQQ